jgi:tRNA modification GTPase
VSSESLTYVVRLTPVGRGAIASLRVVGPRAVSVVDELLHLLPKRLIADVPCNAICYGRWQSVGAGEEVVVCRRETSCVEIHCHGGAAAVAAIVESLCAGGCRELDWQQHLVATSSDPLAAAAEIAMTQAPTERAAVILWEQRNGALRRAIETIRTLLAAGNLAEANERVERLLALAPVGLHLSKPWRVVLAGRPNVGKSSLINALVGFERAIVHATPGTTRDLVAADCAIDGWPVQMTDTAGLRDDAETLEAAGVELAKARLAQADLSVLVFDASSPSTADNAQLATEWPAALHVFNKCDLLADDAAVRDSFEGIRTSAIRGDGSDELARAIVARLIPTVPAPGEGVPFLPEQVCALQEAVELLRAGLVQAAVDVLARPPFGMAAGC